MYEFSHIPTITYSEEVGHYPIRWLISRETVDELWFILSKEVKSLYDADPSQQHKLPIDFAKWFDDEIFDNHQGSNTHYRTGNFSIALHILHPGVIHLIWRVCMLEVALLDSITDMTQLQRNRQFSIASMYFSSEEEAIAFRLKYDLTNFTIEYC